MEVIQGPKFDFSKFTRRGSIYPVHREEILALDKLFFFKIHHLDLGACQVTQQGTWTHGRFTGNNFDFSKLTGPGCGCIHPVHKEEILAPDILIFFLQISHLELGNLPGFNFDFSKFTGPGSIYQVHREENLALDKLFFSQI